MISIEAIIVGGGPAGSSCAWRLKRAGVDCLVLDKETFPRLKLCAGWITPEVVRDLEIDIAAYPHRFLTFDGIRFHFSFVGAKADVVEHSIRRVEFDDWLLRRSGAEFRQHEVRDIARDGDQYIIDGTYRCRYLVGAGGTRCPVHRAFFRNVTPHGRHLQAVTLEEEFPYDYGDGQCHLWFFEKGLPGYSWYVPKADGYLNVGVGAAAGTLKRRGDDIKRHWNLLVDKLRRNGMVRGHEFDPKGYSYYMRGEVEVGRVGNAFVLGDAAGLATRDMAEGIGPAVRTGLMAAESIAEGREYRLDGIARYSTNLRLVQRLFEFKLTDRRGAREAALAPRAAAESA
jgi:flavin-dependent dehydrogenase